MRRSRLAIGALCASLAALQLAAFHWGVITPDSVVQYGQALSGRYDDWHPPVTAWLWRQLLHLGPGGAPFLLFDIMLYWGAIGLIAGKLRARHGFAAGVVPILFAVLPIPFGQIGAILKDPLMACLLLMATALLVLAEYARPVFPPSSQRSPGSQEDMGTRQAPREPGLRRGCAKALAFLLILIAAATRFNALFAAAPLLMLAGPGARMKRPLHFVASATSVAVLLVASNWVINQALLRPSHSHPLYSLINFDLAGIVAHGGPNVYPALDDATARRLTTHCYDPRLYGAKDETVCAQPEDSIADHVARTGDSAVGIWLNAVIRAPGPWLRHRLAHLDWNWRLRVPAVPDDAVYMMSEPNDLGLHFTPNPLTRAVVGAARLMAASPIGRPATWLAIALGLLIVAPRLPSRGIVTALAASALLYGGGYALVSVAPDLRYNLWTMLAVMMGLAIALAERASVGRMRLVSACLPAVLVTIVEMSA